MCLAATVQRGLIFFMVSLHCVSFCVCISLSFTSFACHSRVCYYFLSGYNCYFHSGCYYFLLDYYHCYCSLWPSHTIVVFSFQEVVTSSFYTITSAYLCILLLPFTLLVLPHLVLLYIVGVPSFALLLLLLICLLIVLLKLVLPFPSHFAS